MSLSTRIVLLVWLTSGLLLLASLFTVHRLLLGDYESLVAERESAEIQRVVIALDSSLNHRLLGLEALSWQLLDDQGQLRPVTELSAVLEQAVAIGAQFPDGLLIFDQDATAIAESQFVEGRIGTNYADRDHFQRLFRSDQAVVSEPILGRTTGLPLISFLVPVFSAQGERIAIVGGIVDLSANPLVQLEDTSGNASGALNYILDPVHRLFVYRQAMFDQPQPLPAPGEDALVDAAIDRVVDGTTVRYGNNEYIVASQALPELGWVVMRAIPYQLAIAPARHSFTRFMLISLLAVMLVGLVAWFMARGLTRPLNRMTQRLQGMMEGRDLNSTVKVEGGPEVRALATAMNELANQRKALNQMKSEFVASVSHELRTPLTSLKGGLKLLESGVGGNLPVKASHLITLASRNAERLERLVLDLLDFNRLNSGKLSLKLEAVELCALAKQAVTELSTPAAKQQLDFVLNVSERACVQGDTHRVRQILDNLLSNAMKHAPAGSKIFIAAEKTQDALWCVTVSDQGAGVPDSFAADIFQRFSQAERGDSSHSTGTGLGLAISKQLVEAMGGKIGYYNDAGAHFWFSLPAADQTLAEVEHEHD